MGFDEQAKEKAAKHYISQLDELKGWQFWLLIKEWDRGREIMPEYSLKSAVKRVERENNMTILPEVIALAKGE